MIKNILVDLDDTIYDFRKAEKIAVKKTLESFGLPSNEEVLERYHVLNQEQWKLLEKGVITRDQVKVQRYANLFKEYDITESPEKAALAYENNLAIGHYFVEGAEEFLEKSNQKYNLYMVSNGTSVVQHARIKSGDIEKYFKKIYISEDIGLTKPSIEFFNHCFLDANIKKEETVILGDSLTSDILGGINCGIKTIWFNPNQESNNSHIIPDYEIKNLSEFFTLHF
ncbi:MAG: YjjG family noncanonical pyrimidine nucleotidase [Oscillospiraceae bacterium]|nr:YjjG family noncanonical pyrimidine nucleotidase [Oscillospiraceae bacterium]